MVSIGSEVKALGVSTPALSKGDLGTSNSKKDGYSVKGKQVYAEVAKLKTGELGDSLWVHVGDRNLLSREE